MFFFIDNQCCKEDMVSKVYLNMLPEVSDRHQKKFENLP